MTAEDPELSQRRRLPVSFGLSNYAGMGAVIKESTRGNGTLKEEPSAALGIRAGFLQGMMPERHPEKANGL